jgi:hypothetical protein
MAEILDWQANLEAANVSFIAEVEAPEIAVTTTLDILGLEVDATGASAIDVGYAEDNAKIRRVIAGVPQPRDGARAYAAQYPVVPDAITAQLPRRQVKADRSGRVAAMLAQLARRSILEERAWESIRANDVVGPDGVPLFSASHPHGAAGAQSNHAGNVALSHTTFRAARAAMRSLTRENGGKIDKQPTHLIVGPDSEAAALEVVGADRFISVQSGGTFGGTTNTVGATTYRNVYEGILSVIVTPQISAGEWFLVDASQAGQRPWAYGTDGPAEAVVPEIGDYDTVNLDMMVWQVKHDHAMGPASWQTIYGGGWAL